MKHYFPGGIKERQLNTLSILLISLLLIACTTEEMPRVDMEKLAIEIPLVWESNGTTSPNNRVEINVISFSVVAPVANCAGENIRIYGTIENKVNSIVDGNGVVHFSRHWTIKGLAGEGWNGAPTGTNYDIVGGAEMFVIINPGPLYPPEQPHIF